MGECIIVVAVNRYDRPMPTLATATTASFTILRVSQTNLISFRNTLATSVRIWYPIQNKYITKSERIKLNHAKKPGTPNIHNVTKTHHRIHYISLPTNIMYRWCWVRFGILLVIDIYSLLHVTGCREYLLNYKSLTSNAWCQLQNKYLIRFDCSQYWPITKWVSSL